MAALAASAWACSPVLPVGSTLANPQPRPTEGGALSLVPQSAAEASPAMARPTEPAPDPRRPEAGPVSCAPSSYGEQPPELALRGLRDLVRRRRQDPRVHTCLANALFDAGLLAEAIYEYGEALRLDGTLLEAHRNLAYALLDSGERKAAVQWLWRALGLAPGDAMLRATLRSALRESERHP